MNRMKEMFPVKLIVDRAFLGWRLDKYLHSQFPEKSRTFIQMVIKKGGVLVNGQWEKPSYKISPGENIVITFPKPVPLEILPENIPLEIIYEDTDLIVINKPPGMVIHPGAGNRSGTLVNALLYHFKELSKIGGVTRPGIVHRLDKDTSGVLVVAKNDEVHRKLSEQFSKKIAHREYLALVWHQVENQEGKIETFLNRSKRDRKLFSVTSTGKKAITKYEVVETFRFLTLLRLNLLTGRTHQIRIHLSYIHHPVFGDPQYHGRLKQLRQLKRHEDRLLAKKLLSIIDRQALHAQKLGFIHPTTGEKLSFKSPLPDDFKTVLSVLRKIENKREF